MKRKGWVLVGAAVLVAASVTGGVVVASGSTEGTPAGQEPPANTATVERGKLSAMVSVNGSLTYRARSDGSPYSAINQARGTYTKLPDAGETVECGDAFYRVDDEPVLLLCGTVPAYRDLHTGDQGKDVRQLNRNLHQIGYDTDPDDDAFTWKTQKALERIQHDRGLDETGVLDVDDAVFLPASVRISTVTGTLGGPAQTGRPVAEATSDTIVVRVDLEPSQRDEVKEGDRVQITLPGNTSAKGKVDRLGNAVQTTGKNQEPGPVMIPAFITLNQSRDARGLDGAPVQVDITTTGVQNVLSVPVTALVGKSGGGFAVEVVRSGGHRELVAVKLGLFDTTGGRVEVDGDLGEGDDVVVPSS